MFVQIEITTRCNFQCFYCVGREMAQTHMPWERFTQILAQLPPDTSQVSLQGEGEPMMHPRFWDMVRAIHERGLAPYTITNGSLIDPERVAAAFPNIGISIDTLDASLAHTIGRFKLPRVLESLEKLRQLMGPERIIVHTVHFGQPLQELNLFLQTRSLKHIVQPLQSKADYARCYADVDSQQWGPCTFRCPYLDNALMRYYSLDGKELPCCFIKDTSTYVSADHLRLQLQGGSVPQVCGGCRVIFPQAQVRLTSLGAEDP